MKRNLITLGVVLVITIICPLMSVRAETTAYSFQDLWESASKAAPIIQSKLNDVKNLQLDLDILLTNYKLKWNVGGEALVGLPQGEEKAELALNGETQIAVNLPYGLQLSVGAFMNFTPSSIQ